MLVRRKISSWEHAILPCCRFDKDGRKQELARKSGAHGRSIHKVKRMLFKVGSVGALYHWVNA